MILYQFKYLLFFLLTFLLGVQTTYAKTEVILPQPQVSFSIEQNQNFQSLKKHLQPNIGFLIEKTKFEVAEGFSARNSYEYSERDAYDLGKAGDDVLLASLKTKFAGKTKVLNWLDEVTDNTILTKLDNLPSSSISKMEDDILTLKSHFNFNPNSINSWERLIGAPDAIRKNINILEDIAVWPTNWNLNTVGNSVEVVQNGGRKIATITNVKIVAPARTLTGTAGNPLLNRVPLVKNITYEVDGFEYLTDNLGRVTKTNADLDDLVRVRLGNQQIRAVDIKDGVNGVDQGGHIVASRFFGPGEQINLYPQSANLNQGAWKQMENSWATEMVAGKDVKIEVGAIFSGSSQRPTSFQVKYTIDGQPFQENFINQ